MRVQAILGLLLAALSTSIGYAQPFTYQGFLRQGGNPANGTFSMTFTLFNHPTNTGAGAQVGSPITLNNVAVQNGLFTVELDFGSVWDGSERWLEIRVGATTLSPRVKINPTPYAAYALRPWQTAGSAVFYNVGSVGIGTNAPAARLSLGGDNANTKLALWQGGSAADVMGFGIAPNQFRLHLHTPSNRFSFLNAPNGSELLTILGNGNVGIGTNSPSYPLHVQTNAGDRAIYGFHTAASGYNAGVYGVSASGFGAGVAGIATATSGYSSGVYAETASTEGRGVTGFASAGSGETYGGYFRSASTTGRGVVAHATAGSGFTVGVWGRSDSTGGRGVIGEAVATSGDAIGVAGQSSSPDGKGVFGHATALGGEAFGGYFRTDSFQGRGVLGWASSGAGSPIGVFGQSNSATGFGVYSLGNFAVVGGKAFQIDHPLRPETHYLNHFCTEGPEPYNAYSGNVVTDAKGYATVTLPPYFESINRDFRYQLTVIDASDDFVQAKVVRKIQNNQFVIRTSKPHVEVSWRVEAIRNDLWMQRHGFQAEQEKPEGHRGKYLRPELYGQPEERGIYYRSEPARPNEGETPK